MAPPPGDQDPEGERRSPEREGWPIPQEGQIVLRGGGAGKEEGGPSPKKTKLWGGGADGPKLIGRIPADAYQ